MTNIRLHAGSTPRPGGSPTIDSLAEFASVVSTSFVPLKVSADQPVGFNARLASTQADVVTVTDVSAQPHLVERTPETIENGGGGYYKVSLLLAGSGILMQNGSELLMQPGHLTVYDTSRPYSLCFNEEFRNLILMFPKDQVDLPASLTDQLAAAPLSAENPALSQVLSAFLSQFPDRLDAFEPSVRAKLGRTALSLVGTLFSTVLDAKGVQRDPNQVLLQNIYSFIEARLAQPSLSPSSIAAAHFISVRQLHTLFQPTGTTVSALIREWRLERCYADLTDTVLTNRPVAAIAARWGFVDPAHFSRAFKACYGVSPSEIRHA